MGRVVRVAMEALLELSVVTVSLSHCPGNQWFTKTSDSRWMLALPDPGTTADPAVRPVETPAPWDAVSVNTTSRKDTTNSSLSKVLSLSLLCCGPELAHCRRRTRLYDVLKSSVSLRALCVSEGAGAFRALLVLYDEASHCHCVSSSEQGGRKTKSYRLKMINMTLLDECPEIPHTIDRNSSQANKRNLLLHLTDKVRPPLNKCLPIVDDPGACREPFHVAQWWELAVDVIVCLLILAFIVYVILIIWKRLTKGHNQSSQPENIELDSEETLVDYTEATCSAVDDKMS